MCKPLYISKSKSGNILLHQKKTRLAPKHSHKHYINEYQTNITYRYYEHGDVFRLNNCFNDLIFETVNEMKEAYIVPFEENSKFSSNKLYVTRWKDGHLMLHQKNPIRVEDTYDFGRFIDFGGYRTHFVKKCAKDWSVEHYVNNIYTKQHGHFRIPEFPGSENINYDSEPFAVMISIIEK